MLSKRRILFIYGLFLCVMPLLAADPNRNKATQKAAPKTTVEHAEAHFNASRYTQAEKLLHDYLREQPNSPDAAQSYLLLGQAQEKQNRLDDAERSFKGLISRFPATEWAAQAHEQQALICAKRRNPGAAQKFRNELLSRYPSSPTTARVWQAQADALFEANEFEKSIAIYQKIEKHLSPESLEQLTIARILTTGNGDPSKIIPVAENALNKNNRKLAKTLFTYLSKSPKAGRDLPQILTKLGWCTYLEGGEDNTKQAEKLWQEVIATTKPSNAWYAESKWHLVQMAAGPEENWKKAVSICDSIIKEQSVGTFPHEQALFSKAWLLTVHDQGRLALAVFDELGSAYPEKMLQPAIQRHIAAAKASAEKQSGNAQ